MALDEASLRNFSKQVARNAIDGTVGEIVSELQAKKAAALVELEVERSSFESRLKEHEASIARLGMMVKSSVLIGILALIVAFAL